MKQSGVTEWKNVHINIFLAMIANWGILVKGHRVMISKLDILLLLEMEIKVSKCE